MGWEQRNGRSYYYRKRRHGDRVVSEYVGSGTLAAICAQTDAASRQEQENERKARQQEREEEARVDTAIAEAEATLKTLTECSLFAAGFHKHKGQWRKRRNESKGNPSKEDGPLERDESPAQED